MGLEKWNNLVRDSLGLFEFKGSEKCNSLMRDYTLQFVNKELRLRFTESSKCFLGGFAYFLGFKLLKLKHLM